jgi:TetR/AcrR family transcriptional regulator, mexJK operon transcriptional repressor
MAARRGGVGAASEGARDRRTEILDAAAEIFLDKGFDQTAMDAVAARAGVSKATVYAHYRDKTGLFEAVIERGSSALDVNLDRTLGGSASAPEPKLVEVAMALLEAVTRTNYLAMLGVLLSERNRRPELARSLRRSDMPYAVGVVASILADDAAQRGYTLADPAAHASLYIRMIAGSLQMDALLNTTFRPDRELLQSHAQWVTRVFLNGVRPRPETPGPAQSTPPPGYSYPWPGF